MCYKVEFSLQNNFVIQMQHASNVTEHNRTTFVNVSLLLLILIFVI